MRNNKDIIVRRAAGLAMPFILVYSFYLILHGHLSPGGGFQGGALISAAMILFAIVFGLKEGERRMPRDLSLVLESSVVLYAVIGLVGIALGYSFLANKLAGIPIGKPGKLLSSGIILALNVIIGLKVASTGKSLFYSIAEEEK